MWVVAVVLEPLAAQADGRGEPVQRLQALLAQVVAGKVAPVPELFGAVLRAVLVFADFVNEDHASR